MSDAYWTDLARRRRLSRRSLIRGGGAAGAGLIGAALIGCGGDDDETATPTATSEGGGGGGGGGTGTPEATATATEMAANEPQRGGIYHDYGVVDPTSLDPYANLSYTVKIPASLVYSRLYRIDAQPDVPPEDAGLTQDLAESAESPDGMTWTVKLKQGAKFHNLDPVSGREITSDDVVFSFNRLTADESPGASLVPAGMTLEAIDDYTLEFNVPEPSPTFLDFLADANLLWIMPTEADGGFDPAQTPIGSGPFVFKQYDVSSLLAYDANPEYYVEGIPYMDGFEFAIIPEYANYKAQFLAGKIDEFTPQSNDILDMQSQNADLQWHGAITLGLLFVYFSGADQDPDAAWRDPRFRQAVSMSIDREGLFDLYYNYQALTDAGFEMSSDWNNVMPRGYGSRAWLDPTGPEQGESAAFFNYDTAEAMKLVDAVGGSDESFTYQYTGNGYGATFLTYAEAIQGWISAIGLNPQTETQDYSSQYITHTFRGDFHGLATGYQTPFPEPGSWVNRMFGDDPANGSRVHDPDIDALNAKQKVELDPEARVEQFHEIQRISDSMMYYVPTPGAGGTAWTSYQPRVNGIRSTRGYGHGAERWAYYWINEM
jgi:peptide/nickel transport system substrate-binding protein